MKKLTLFSSILMVLLSCACLYGQSFEGKIMYKNKYKSKLPTLPDEQLDAMMGTLQEYYISKEGNFKSVTNGSFVQWQLYIQKENKLYNKLSSSESLYWIDASIAGDEIVKTILTQEAIEILGYKCDELILVGKAGTQRYYFNSKFNVDPALFANFKFGNWSDFITNAKALPLKMIIESAQFVLESEAIDAKPSTLDATLFALPTGAVLEKSPYIPE